MNPTEDMFARLGEALTVLRALGRMPQAELARRAGIKATQVSRYETGQVLPQLPQLSKLLGALDVGLPEFFFTLLYVERIADFLEQGKRLPAESMARDRITAFWRETTDLHLELARAVRETLEEKLGVDIERVPEERSERISARDERIRRAQEEGKRDG